MEPSSAAWQRTLTVAQAYEAVRELVFIYWETGGRAEDEIAVFGGSLAEDPALAADWLLAVEKVIA